MVKSMREKIRGTEERALPAGYTTRPATHDDIQPVTDLLNLDSLKHVGVERFSYDECEQAWTEPGFDLAGSSRMVFDPNGELRGYVEIWDTGSAPVSAFAMGVTHPDFYDRGIGTDMLTWAEGRARKTIDRLPKNHPFTLQAVAAPKNQNGRDLLQSVGMSHVRTFYTMRIDLNGLLEPPASPAGVSIKQLSADDDLWPVFQAMETAFEDHYNHEAKTEAEVRQYYEHRLADPAFDPTLCFAAFEQGELAGGLIGYPKSDEDPTIGLVDTLGVLRPFRRKGIARALLENSFALFSSRPQFKAVQLGVDGSSLTGANKLYEKAGMYTVRSTELFEKNLKDG